MKKIVIGSLLLMVLFSTSAIAGGTADIPLWKYFRTSQYNAFYTQFYVTNRGEEPITVTLKLYNSDGSSTPRYDQQVTLPAHGTSSLAISQGMQTEVAIGSGTISWEYTNSSQARSKNMRKPLCVTVGTDRFGFKTDGKGWIASISWQPLMVDGDIWF